MSDLTPNDVLDFWFVEAGPAKWYAASSGFDARMRRRFAKHVERESTLLATGHHPWQDSAFDALALVILLDQFPRNIWRGSGRAFAYDAQALSVSKAMIESGLDWAIPESQRAFLYMPFMHSESLSDQNACVKLADERLAKRGTMDHAIKHRAVIEKFGRFPYRNIALARQTTPEEQDYLVNGGYAPGRKDSAKSA